MPEVILEDRFSGDPFEIAIYQNNDVTDRRGRLPERVVADYASHALSNIGVNHRILYDFPTIPIDNNNNGCPGPNKTVAYDLWGPYLRNEAPFVAKDSNILINDAGGGGCGSVGGNVCVGPGRDINRYINPEDRQVGHINDDAQRQWDFAVYSCLHEMGHNMGFSHEPNPGLAFTDSNNLRHKTPTIGNNNRTTNLCGEVNPADPDNREGDIPHLYYHDCVADHINTKSVAGTLDIVSVDVEGSPVVRGESNTISIEAENNTGSRVNQSFNVRLNGQVYETITFDIGPGQDDTRRVAWTPEVIENVAIDVGGVTRNVTVQGPPGGSRTLAGLPPEIVVVGGALAVIAYAMKKGE